MTSTIHVRDPAWEARLQRQPLPGAALFGSRTSAEVLGLLTLHPGRRFGVRDIVFLVGTNLESTQRATERLAHAGVLAEEREGRRRDFVVPAGARTLALRELVLGTVTLAPRLGWAADELGAAAVVAAFVHGSIARGTEGPDSDVDIVVAGEAGIADLAPYLADLEHLMGRSLNAICFSPSTYAAGVAAPAGFLRRIAERPRMLIGVGDTWLRETEADALRAA